MRIFALLIIISSLLLLGCTAPEYNGPGASCSTDSFCAPGLSCTNSSCQPAIPGGHPTASPPGHPTVSPSGQSQVSPTATPSSQPYAYPHSDVDIYTKGVIYGQEDTALQPTIATFGAGSDMDSYTLNKAKKNGVRYISSVSLWNNDEWKKISDLPPEVAGAYAVDIDGKPVQSQHMVALNLNDPAMQKWFRDYVKRQHDAGADGLLFDEVQGMSAFLDVGAPFDNYTMRGFAQYLNNSSFDYSEYLLSHGYRDVVLSNGDYPMKAEFKHYLESQASDFIIELIDYAKSLWGDPYISANYDPTWAVEPYPFASHLNDFTFEHQFTHPDWREAASGVRVTPSIRYIRHLNKRAIAMMWIGDYGYLGKLPADEANRLVQRYLAETYASGGYFLYFDMDVPFEGNQFSADHSKLAPYFNFIRQNPELFRGSWESTVAVPLVSHIDATLGTSLLLEDAHVAHTVTGSHPAGYATVITPSEDLGYHYYKTEDPADIEKLKALYPGLDYWDASSKVSIYPRGNNYHLVNYGEPRGQFNIIVSLPAGLVPTKAAYYQPGKEKADALLSLSGNHATITIPGLDIWGVVRLE